MIAIVVEDPGTADALQMLGELSAALQAITGSSGAASFDANDVRIADARFVVARDEAGTPVGCGAFRPLEAGVAEIKRMYARSGPPGVPGVGSAILTFLEDQARHLGLRALRLETRVVNRRAVAFYARHGYVRIPNFGKYAGRAEAACFEKQLRA
ncbi:MAG: GNAT family N-acetyltransferase [Duganella sp.]